MSDDEKALVIVYQFGKVASTSLVDTLNACPGIDAHQSHFLGPDALQRIVPIAVDKGTSDYFYSHLSGQLASNLKLTFQMNKVLSGAMPGPLRVVSLSREPLDWLRSGIVQDIDGYRDDILGFAQKLGIGDTDDCRMLSVGLARILNRVAAIIDIKGGIQPTLAEFLGHGGKHMLDGIDIAQPPIVRRMFFLAIRPLVWFDEHFTRCFGVPLSAFVPVNGFWRATGDRVEFVILRYEDLSTHLQSAMRDIGIELDAPLKRHNLSGSKPHADDVMRAFATEAAETLRRHLLSSGYAQHFGYELPETSLRATA